MTSRFSARRRADEFEALVSRSSGTKAGSAQTTGDVAPSGVARSDLAGPYARMLALVDDLRAVPEVQPRAEFTASLRERLMAEADTVLVPTPRTTTPSQLLLPPRSRKRDRRIAALIGGAVLAGSTATMAVAAQGSLPGEALYPVKRGIEAAQVNLAGDDVARGHRLLANAEERLSELEDLVAQDDVRARALIPDTLDDFTDQASAGSDLILDAYPQTADRSDVEAVRSFSGDSMDRLAAIEPQLPPEAREGLAAAGLSLVTIDEQAAAMCPTCAGGLATTPDFLLTSGTSDLLTGLDTNSVQLDPEPLSPDDSTQPEGSTSSSTDPLQEVGDKVGETIDGLKETTGKVGSTVDETTDGVKKTTGDAVGGLDDATKGAVGGLGGAVDDATDGLIGDVTGTLDSLTGGSVTDATGGVLP